MENEETLWLVDYEDWLQPQSIGMIQNSGRLFVNHLIKNLQTELLEITNKEHMERRTLPVPKVGTDEEKLRNYRDAADTILKEVQAGDRVLAFGQGHWFQSALQLETGAVNRFASPGQEGNLTIVEAGHDLRMEAARAERIKALVANNSDLAGLAVSTDAATYYCNAFLYLMMNKNINGDFFHLPAFMEGDEERAGAFFAANVDLFAQHHPGKTATDFAMSSNEDAARILVQFLQAERSGF